MWKPWLLRSFSTDSITYSFFPFFLPLEISSYWKISIAITPGGTQKALLTPLGRKYLIGLFFLTFPSVTPTLLTFIAPLAVAPPTMSPLLPSFALEGPQDLDSDHPPILLTLPFFSLFPTNSSFSFQKACWGDFALLL